MANYVDFRLSLDSEQRLARVYPLLKNTLSDLRPIFTLLAAETLPQNIREIFAEEGSGWRRLAPATVRQRERRIRLGQIHVSPDHPILVQTGALRESLISRSGFGHHERLLRDGMVWGSSLRYAAMQHYGTSRIPRRQILQGRKLIPAVSRVLENEIPVHLRRAMRQFG